MKNLIILSDYGLDDAVALIYLLDNNKWDKIDIVAIAGNSTAAKSLSNLQKLLANYWQVDEIDTKTDDEIKQEKKLKTTLMQKITIVDTTDKQQPFTELPSIHGDDGMGDLFINSISNCKCIKWNEWIAGVDKDGIFDIVSLGPATLVKDVINHLNDKDNSTLLMMGHCIDAVPNLQGEEFNYKLDEETFEWCINNTRCIIATLDTCRDEYFNLANAKIKSNSPIFDTVINKSIQLAVARHADNAFIYDYIACGYLINPNNFEVKVEKTRKGNHINHLKLKKS